MLAKHHGWMTYTVTCTNATWRHISSQLALYQGTRRQPLCLVPNIDNPKLLEDYRPIELCSFFCKLSAKILVVGENWGTPFLFGRSILGNILLVQKILHPMNSSMMEWNLMVLKVDMERAYMTEFAGILLNWW